MEDERERGPIEKRLHDLIRNKASSTPWFLNAQTEGRELTAVEHLQQGQYMDMVLMEAVLELAREVDDLLRRLDESAIG